MRGTVLFGGFNTGKRCKEENTVRASLLNCKAYIAKKLMGGETSMREISGQSWFRPPLVTRHFP
ncbi:Hypothetical protein FKW44_017530 [Caligus rogercresseyi]|uniref:Uncharacterized protein n=1 Tax=Caligus rogercresseyi TaxID=217165 RepID=A0A7T8GTI3_CALRO|nr:Hypothetical protein FKW44_017530 [Caligus rogercresseyi]